jgi:hypothetical protein
MKTFPLNGTTLQITFELFFPYSQDVIKKIGRGKYSEVFEGTNTLNGEECVIKVLKFEFSKN